MQKHIHLISVFIFSLFVFVIKAQAAVLFLPHANYGYAETCLRLGMTDTMRSGYVCEQKSVIDER